MGTKIIKETFEETYMIEYSDNRIDHGGMIQGSVFWFGAGNLINEECIYENSKNITLFPDTVFKPKDSINPIHITRVEYSEDDVIGYTGEIIKTDNSIKLKQELEEKCEIENAENLEKYNKRSKEFYDKYETPWIVKLLKKLKK